MSAVLAPCEGGEQGAPNLAGLAPGSWRVQGIGTHGPRQTPSGLSAPIRSRSKQEPSLLSLERLDAFCDPRADFTLTVAVAVPRRRSLATYFVYLFLLLLVSFRFGDPDDRDVVYLYDICLFG